MRTKGGGTLSRVSHRTAFSLKTVKFKIYNLGNLSGQLQKISLFDIFIQGTESMKI